MHAVSEAENFQRFQTKVSSFPQIVFHRYEPNYEKCPFSL